MADSAPPTAPAASHARPPVGWMTAVVAIVLATLARGVQWGWHHPLPTTWDEAHYYAALAGDHFRWSHVGPRRFLAGLVYGDGRPPAYRLLVAPWVVWAGVDFAPLRAINVLWLSAAGGLAAAVVHRLTRSAPAAVLSAAAVCLTAKVFASTIHFGTEPALYVSTLLTFAGLVLDWDRPRPRRLGWTVLAAGLALAVLAKASSLVMVTLPPVMVAILYWTGRVRGPSPAYLLKAIGAAAVVAGPWWAVNWRRALTLAEGGVTYQRRSFGPLGLRSCGRYVAELFHYEVGLSISLPAVVLLAAWGWRAAGRSRRPTSAVDWAVLTLVVPSLVTIVIQMASVNQDGRLVSHAYVAMSVAAGLAAARLGWLRSAAVRAVLLAAVAVQALMLAGPPSAVSAVAAQLPAVAVAHNPVLRPWDMWDWRPLQAACDARGLRSPSVALLGQSFCFNVPQVEVPWARDGLTPKVTQLWRWEQPAFSMDATTAAAAEADVVLTVPGLLGSPTEHEELDNAHNAAFAARLTANPAYEPPVRLTLGRLTPTTVDVFFRRGRAGRPGR